MKKSHIIWLAVFYSLILTAAAQDTNSLRTDIGIFEARSGTVIVKAFGPVGSISAGTSVISVSIKESTNINTGQKLYGLAIEIESAPLPRERIYVDYDEVDSLLNAINYLNKIDYDVTSLPGFEASYATRAGLRIGTNSIRKQGATQAFLQYCGDPKIALTSMQMTQLSGLIGEARKSLDALKTSK